MLIRYGIDESGRRYERARIYTVNEHGISRDRIDKEALLITDRLQSEGYHAYIVGGAVRDLLNGKTPKDFDITTDAKPKRVRRLFWNSRIIGRRFRLVHVHFRNEMIIEVSTFRSNEPGADSNDFGTLEGDVERRDFSINALYYDPSKEHVLDFVSAMKDVKSRRMRSLLPLDSTFIEDPVRMIRAVKYAAGGGFSIPFALKKSIRKYTPRLAEVSTSRMTEEVFKIYEGGNSAPVMRMAEQYGLLEYMIPTLWKAFSSTRKGFREYLVNLKGLDAMVREQDETSRGEVIKMVFSPYLGLPSDLEFDQLFKFVFREYKDLLHPLTPPNADVETAVKLLFEERGIVREKKKKKRRRRRKKKKAPQDAGPENGNGAETYSESIKGASPSSTESSPAPGSTSDPASSESMRSSNS